MSTQRALIVTMAGTSTRFRATAGREVLKCLYHEGKMEESLLGFFTGIAQAHAFNAVRFVGGYQFDELQAAVGMLALAARTAGAESACVFNPDFATKGSGYSLLAGLRDLLRPGRRHNLDEILFMEGDLAVDRRTLAKVIAEPGDVFTACREPITAEKSVAVYQTLRGDLRFIYDPAHHSLTIPEPFCALYNSGQVWKFADLARLAAVVDRLTAAEEAGTNLVIVEKYFQAGGRAAVHTFDHWINCNTLADYHRARALFASDASCPR
jgi:CTP:molybdopterin cytidylyltransferase MocA